MTTYKTKKAQKIYLFRLTVRCSSVPYDMMRYDRCVPDSEEDAHKLERIASGNAVVGDRIVTFVQYCKTNMGPTLGRWPGFGGQVLSVEPIGE